MLKQRILTALALFIPLLLVIWFLPMPWFGLLIGLVILIGAWEWANLLQVKYRWFRVVYTLLVMIVILLNYFLPVPWTLLVTFGVWMWASLAVVFYGWNRRPLGFECRWVKGIMGFIALVPCWLSVCILREDIGGPFWLLFGLMVIWAVDTGAYAAGHLWGKRLLIKRVSPKKTWEGMWGGLALAVLFSVVVCLIMRVPFARLLLITSLSLITAIFAVMGDLFESMLKRQIDVKDSGGVLPGHGGILDRIDSIVAGLPIFTLGSLFLGGFLH